MCRRVDTDLHYRPGDSDVNQMRTSVLPQLGCGLECLFVVFHRGHRSQVNLTTAMPTCSLYMLEQDRERDID